jgi:hypothetical protein
MKRTIVLLLLTACTALAAKKPEQWLTPERRAALKVIVTRPVIVKKEHLPDGRMILTWTNGLHGCVTTQKVEKVLGKPSKDARRDNLEAIKAERDTAKAERDALKLEVQKNNTTKETK